MVGAGSECLRLFLAAIQLANRVGANLLDHVLDGRGLLAFAVFPLVGAADERAYDAATRSPGPGRDRAVSYPVNAARGVEH